MDDETTKIIMPVNHSRCKYILMLAAVKTNDLTCETQYLRTLLQYPDHRTKRMRNRRAKRAEKRNNVNAV